MLSQLQKDECRLKKKKERAYLAGAADAFVAHFAGAGVQFLVTADAVRALVPQDVLLPEQRQPALLALVAL